MSRQARDVRLSVERASRTRDGDEDKMRARSAEPRSGRIVLLYRPYASLDPAQGLLRARAPRRISSPKPIARELQTFYPAP